MTFCTPNKLARFRSATFSTKEPETLDWIDTFADRSVVWDIGANVGNYSIYAAKKGHRVLAFEASVFNLELLVRNISLNSVQDKVTILPFPLNEQSGINSMHIGNSSWGGALSSFDKNTGWDGKPIDIEFSYDTYGLTIDHAVNQLALPKPAYIKLDVDGIEHLILSGATQTIASIKSVLIEVNDDLYQQAYNVHTFLESNGLTLIKKMQSEMVKHSEMASICNQIWTRIEDN